MQNGSSERLPREKRMNISDFPEYINTSKYVGDLKQIVLYEFDDEIAIELHSNCAPNYEVISYYHTSEGCTVEYYDRRRKLFLKDQFYATVAGRDFGLLMKHQKSILEYFKIVNYTKTNIYVPLMEAIDSNLKSRQDPLKVETFRMFVPHQQDQLLKIWNRLDANTLRDVSLSMDRMKNDGNMKLEMNRIVKTDQWKKAKILHVYYIISSTPLANFHHVYEGSCRLSVLFPREIMVFKDKILQNTPYAFSSFDVEFSHLATPNRILKLLGQPHFENGNVRKWYYRFSGTNDALIISWNASKHRQSFLFKRCLVSNIQDYRLL